MSRTFLGGEGATRGEQMLRSKMRASMACLGLHWFMRLGYRLSIVPRKKQGTGGSRAEPSQPWCHAQKVCVVLLAMRSY